MNEQNSPSKKMATWKKALIGLMVLIIGVVIKGMVDPGTEAAIALEPKRTQKKLTDAYVRASIVLKKNMKDPESFEEISHDEYYLDNKDSASNKIEVLIKYRSKNSFGGYVVGKKGFTVDSSGTVIEAFTPAE